MPISESSRLKRASHLLETDVHGEVVALDVDRGQVYGLDSIGTEIWHLLERQTSVAEICTRLAATYDVDPETCRRDVLKLLGDLHDEGLVTVEN